LDLDSGFVGYEENEHEEMDLSLLNEKESTKVLARMNKEAHRATLKKQKEEAKEKEKNRKAAEKAKKPHDKSIQKVAGKSLNILEVIIDASPSSQLRRRDAILVGLSFSTL
jgi:RecA-family ATPase